MAKISENIQAVRDQIQQEPENGPKATKIGTEGVAALFAGKGTDEWNDYMENFVTNDLQRQRLRGNDTPFNNSPYGSRLIAYVVAAAPCMSGTETSLATEEMSQEMKDLLDAGTGV